MKDLSRTIATMSAMAGISSSACHEGDELCKDKALDNLFAVGKELGKRLAVRDGDDDENDMSAFYEEFGNIISKFKSKGQITAVSKSFSDEALVFGNYDSDAVSFTDLRMSALMSGDPTAVADVEAAFYQAVEKCRTQNGDDEAEQFRLMCEYANAGAMLGAEFADARRANDMLFAEDVRRKAVDMSDSLSSDCYGDIFRRAYTHYSVNA